MTSISSNLMQTGHLVSRSMLRRLILIFNGRLLCATLQTNYFTFGGQEIFQILFQTMSSARLQYRSVYWTPSLVGAASSFELHHQVHGTPISRRNLLESKCQAIVSSIPIRIGMPRIFATPSSENTSLLCNWNY